MQRLPAVVSLQRVPPLLIIVRIEGCLQRSERRFPFAEEQQGVGLHAQRKDRTEFRQMVVVDPSDASLQEIACLAFAIVLHPEFGERRYRSKVPGAYGFVQRFESGALSYPINGM